jgi:LPS sulfotransferase NodH
VTAQDLILDDNEVALAGPEYDQAPSPLKRFIVIAATGRTGSYMLARMLKQLGYGVPLEYYNPIYRDGFADRWGVDAAARTFPADFLDALIRHRTTTNGFCAVKSHANQFAGLAAGLDARGVSELCYIHLWRRDTLAQAISLRLAYQSGIWNFTPAPTTPPKENLDMFDLDALHEARRLLVKQEFSWRVHFQRGNVRVAHGAYEDLVEERARELRRLVAFIDPGRMLPSPLTLDEPPSGQGLRTRQQLSEADRAALRRAYEEKFGPAIPMSEP